MRTSGMTRRRVATLLALAAVLVALSLPLLAQAVDLEGFEGDAELDQQTFTGDSDQSGFEPPSTDNADTVSRFDPARALDVLPRR